MEGKGPKHERETVIVFNEAEDSATVWTASEVVYRRLRRLGYFPIEDRERSASFEVPKNEVRLPRPKAKRRISDASLEALKRGRLRQNGLINTREQPSKATG